ncbi:hypothetical protein DAPPUDRAFT_263107 [Daphnia pulex]|uniref:Uncharacterized protein n=1 Tax=Daphnia pulex TaxID=6669 RepID=E9HP44_DAPPU|nr:hypothetical protein DAPPUDRAFT_263107 [Daphnia pulex]|eukprot:EFX66499.1 hypothetical protein DAPPUDRAFT_263107 [Daphnia pulex]
MLLQKSKLDARVIKKGLYSPLYIELHNKILTATKRRECEDIFISLLEEELQQIRNAMGKVYQGTYHGKTNDRHSKKWIRTYKAMKEKLAKELARKYQAFVEKVLETMLDEIVETVVIPFYDRFKLKDIIKHYTRIRDQDYSSTADYSATAYYSTISTPSSHFANYYTFV